MSESSASDLSNLDREVDALLAVSLEKRQWAMTREGDDFRFLFPDGTRIRCTRIHAVGDTPASDLLIEHRAYGRLHFGRLHLTSTSGQEGLIKKLDRKVSEISWAHHIEEVCHTVSEAIRRGEPEICAAAIPLVPLRYAIAPLVLANEINIIYGYPEVGKSLFAQACAVAVVSGMSLPGGLTVSADVIGPALYLDYETNEETFRRRIGALATALGADEGTVLNRIWYRRMGIALADDATAVRAIIARRAIRFVVVDSWRLACGAIGSRDPADATTSASAALRSFNCTDIAVAHAPKLQKGTAPDIYGSVFNRALARSVVFVKRIGDEHGSTLRIVLVQDKLNEGPHQTPIGLALTFEGSADGFFRIASIRASDLTTEPDAYPGQWDQVKSVFLRERRKLRVKEIAAFLELPPATVRTILNDHKLEVVSSDDPSGGKEKLWSLVDNGAGDLFPGDGDGEKA